MSRIVISDHCRERWRQRFPDANADEAAAGAVYVPLKELRRWASAAAGGMRRFRAGTEYRYHHGTGAVFVLARPSDRSELRVAVTVLRFRRPDGVRVAKPLRARLSPSPRGGLA